MPEVRSIAVWLAEAGVLHVETVARPAQQRSSGGFKFKLLDVVLV